MRKQVHRNGKLESAIALFLMQLRSPHTVKNYRSDIKSLNNWFAPFSGKESALELAQFIRAQEKAGLMATTVRERCSRVSRLLLYLSKAGIRTDAPNILIAAPRTTDRRSPKSLTPEELNRLRGQLNLMTTEGLRDASMIALMLFDALRVGEVSSLNLSDVTATCGSFTLEVRGKGGYWNTVTLWPQSARIVKRYLKCIKDRPSSAPLFTAFNKPKQRLSTSAIHKRITGYFAAAKIRPNLGPHALRWTHASTLANMGAPVTLIQQRLRHRDLETTVQYICDLPTIYSQKMQRPDELIRGFE